VSLTVAYPGLQFFSMVYEELSPFRIINLIVL
jgi:hypothetical protein